MSKRLQIVVSDAELERYHETARQLGMTLSEWARQVLRAAADGVSRGDVERKLAALDRAARYSFPTADIEEILAETERGHTAGLP